MRTYSHDMIEIECAKYGRRGRLRTARLLAEHGPDRACYSGAEDSKPLNLNIERYLYRNPSIGSRPAMPLSHRTILFQENEVVAIR